MSAGDPHRFSARWLRFDPERPTRTHLVKRFAIAVIGLLIVCALMTMLPGGPPVN